MRAEFSAMTTLNELFARHGVTCDRLEAGCEEWCLLLDELLTRLCASGWRARRLTRVKIKLGSLRVYLDPEGETEEFLRWASALTAEIRLRSAR
jgi:hypothetical protein